MENGIEYYMRPSSLNNARTNQIRILIDHAITASDYAECLLSKLTLIRLASKYSSLSCYRLVSCPS